MSNENQKTSSKVEISIQHQADQSKAVEAAQELQKEERQSELLNVDPEQVLEEQKKTQPQSQEE